MQKIPTLFVRDPENRANVLDEVTPGCEWVIAGEGKATQKFDGTCMMLDEGGKWWARREVKPGKAAPENYLVDNVDEVTGKTQGWEPVEQSPFAKFHAEAVKFMFFGSGTYELVGPKIQGNPEQEEYHTLLSHAGAQTAVLASHEIAYVKKFVCNLGKSGWEGIVWHHPDGRMAKLKARDLTNWDG